MPNPKKTVTSSYGFTLIELMVVIAILAILTVIALAVYANIMPWIRDVIRLNDSRQIQAALSQDYYSHGETYTIPDSYWGHVNIHYASQFAPLFSSGKAPADPKPDPDLPESNYKLSLCRSNPDNPIDDESPNAKTYMLCVYLETCFIACNRSHFPSDGELSGPSGSYSGHCSPASDGTTPRNTRGWYCVRK